MKFISLGSGSSGNCYLLQSGETSILLDAGISIRSLKKYLKDIGLSLEDDVGLACYFFFTDGQQELCFFADTFGSIGDLLGEHVLLFQEACGIVEQRDGFLPETDVRFHIAFDDGPGFSCMSLSLQVR